MDITKKYEIHRYGVIKVLKDNYITKCNDNIRLILQKQYDYYQYTGLKNCLIIVLIILKIILECRGNHLVLL